MKKIKLYCFSYAGGTATVYSSWKRIINPLIELRPIEMPGRGACFNEQLLVNIEEMAAYAFNIIKNKPDDSKYALLGHSMGTMIIHELIHKMKNAGYSEPLHVFFSGRYPPHFRVKNPIHQLSDEAFKNEIFKLGGTPKELIEDSDLFDVFLPILRADYKAIEQYKYRELSKKPDFDISVFYGRYDEEIKEYDYSKWSNYTYGNCGFYGFEGGHFFIHDNIEQIAKIINGTLIDKCHNKVYSGISPSY